MARIELDLAHAYAPNPKQDSDYALLPLKMTFEDGGAYALLGPSGCGKTTLLNIMSGRRRAVCVLMVWMSRVPRRKRAISRRCSSSR